MALINCPECGKEISDTCESCIHCGYKLSNDSDPKVKQSGKKKISIIAILLIVIAIIGVIITSILIVNSVQEKNRIEQEKQEQILAQEEEEKLKQAEIEAHKLTYEETVCYYAIEYFKTTLKNPNSLQIHDIQISPSLLTDDLYDEEKDKDPNRRYSEYAIYLDYSAQNGFGGSNRETYYIIMEGTSVSEDSFIEQFLLEGYYLSYCSFNIDVNKIKYAIDHPEVLDY